MSKDFLSFVARRQDGGVITSCDFRSELSMEVMSIIIITYADLRGLRILVMFPGLLPKIIQCTGVNKSKNTEFTNIFGNTIPGCKD